jgi:hypothetical protein
LVAWKGTTFLPDVVEIYQLVQKILAVIKGGTHTYDNTISLPLYLKEGEILHSFPQSLQTSWASALK